MSLCTTALHAERVLILPFSNISKAKSIDWIGDSLSETILEALASEGVDVVRPEERDEMLTQMNVRRYALLTRASATELAVNLDAGIVLYGELDSTPAPAGSTSRGNLRISARALDVRKVRRLGEFNVSGALEDLSSMQTTLSWQALKVVVPQSGQREEDFKKAHPAVRLDALESYMRGLLATNPDQKHKLFTSAARLEPTFSPPCFQLGKLNYGRENYRPAAEWFRKVGMSDLHYRESLFYLGLSSYYTGDFRAAAEAFRRLSGLVPMAEVMNNLGASLLRLGESGDLDAFEKASEADNAEPAYLFNAGYALWRRGDFAKAADKFRAAVQRAPEDETATRLLGLCLKQQGPRPGDLRTENLERVKGEYNEAVWLSLKAMLAGKK